MILYVTDEIFSRTEGLFRFEALGEKIIKGKEKPIKTYQVIAPMARATRFDIRAKTRLNFPLPCPGKAPM